MWRMARQNYIVALASKHGRYMAFTGHHQLRAHMMGVTSARVVPSR